MMTKKNIINTLFDYINDNDFQLKYFDNYLNIINYQEIISFSLKEITICSKKKRIIINGSNLVIKKMLDEELLIYGNVQKITFDSII